MKNKKHWPYKPYEPLNLSPGRYTVWIFASGRFGRAYSAGKSGCAWEIHNERGEIVDAPESLITDRAQSSVWRGYIAAATRGLERTPDRSTATICSRHETILHSIEAIDENKKNGWRNKQGVTLEDTDIWERLLLARDGDKDQPRRKRVKTRKATSELDEEIIKRLQKKAGAALDRTTGKKKRRGK